MAYDPRNPTVNPYASLPGLLGAAATNPYVDPRMAGYGGAAQAIAPMMGPQTRRYGMGQVLAAAGGGLAQGMQQAQSQNISMQQVQQQLEQAKIARQLAVQQNQALQGMAAKLGLPPGTPSDVIMEAMKAQTKAGEFGTPTVVADPDSPTGYSSVQIAQSGEQRVIGPAKPPTSMYDPEAPMRKFQAEAAFGRYEKAAENIDVADATLGNIEQMAQLVDQVDSGTFAETKLDFLKTAKSLGIDVNAAEIASAEAMKSKGMDFILQKISQTKGAISEKEMKAFEAASAGIKNTPVGNKMILELARRVAERAKYENNAVRQAYEPGMTAKELDDIKLKAREEFGSVVPGGVSPAPEGVAPDLWNAMTPEEQAAWQ